MRSHTGEVRGCYEAALAEDAALEGRVQVRFQIDADGTVGEAVVSASELAHPSLEACIVDAIRTFVFDPPEGGGVVTVNYPFQFRNVEDAGEQP